MAGVGEGLLGGLLSGFSQGLLARKQQKEEKAQQGQQQLINLYTAAIESGDLDPSVGFPLVAQIISGTFDSLKGDQGKGAKGKNGSMLDKLFDPSNLSSVFMGAHGALAKRAAGPTGLPSGGPIPRTDQVMGTGEQTQTSDETAKTGERPPLPGSSTMQAPPRSSIFRTAQERAAQEEGQFAQRETFKTNEQIRAAKEEGRYTKVQPWTTDTTKGSDLTGVKQDVLGNAIDPSKSYKTRELPDGTVEARPTEFSSAKTPKTDTSKLGQLTRRLKLLNPNLSDDQAATQAAQRMEAEDQLSQTQKTGRYNAYLRASDNLNNLSRERLTEAQTLFPLHTAAAQAGIDLSKLRLSQADTKTPQAAAKVLEQFTKAAAQIRDKRSMIGELTDAYPMGASAGEIADQLLLEAGQDPKVLRAQAAQAYQTPSKPAGPPPGSITTPSGVVLTPLNP